jgi:diguanylate cyclase (GGDEF)-like protein
MGAVMLGASIPFIGNILYIMGFHPVPGFDVTPVAFMITGIAIVWGVRHCRLWSMTPIAHRIILHTIADGIIVLDSGHRIVEINPAASYLVSFKEQIVVGRKIESVIPNEPELYEALGKTQQVINLTIASPNAPFGFFEVTVTPFHHASSRNIAWILVFHDMTERRRLEERLHFMAFYDSLTCLPNRELFTDQVEYILSDDGRCGKTALMYIDLDDFKSVNDLFGHSVGDNLLREVARRLNEKAKVSDMIARLCGDEFVVICTDLLGEKDALIAARRLMSVFSYPFDLPDGPRKISASIGCVFISEGGETVDSLLHSADMEMYEAKRSGGGQICISKKSDKGLRKVS